MPGMLLRDGDLLGPFGVVGGAMQPPAHLQLVRYLVEEGADPQAALDAPRWRLLDDWAVELEPGLAGRSTSCARSAIRSDRYEPPPVRRRADDPALEAGCLVGGSDGRADGYAAGPQL